MLFLNKINTYLRIFPRYFVKNKVLRFSFLILACCVRYLPFYWVINVRRLCYKFLMNKMGDNCNILDSVVINNPSKISMGERVSVHQFCYFTGSGSISVGSFVAIANGTSIISETHNFDKTCEPIKVQGCSPEDVVIEDDVWIGSRCVILGNVRVGRGSVIGAGSVVTKDIPPFSIAVGVPCKVVKKRKNI